MACTKETYTATATWTTSQLADIFRDAFIDAGLMTDWFDSFLNGSVENRILKVEYDNTKTYGTTYYWWMFNTNGVYLHVATGWDAIAHEPTGTQYLDYYSTTTSSASNHWNLVNPSSTSITVELVRYTSGVDTSQSWFVVKWGSTRRAFTIINASKTIQPWMDLNKGFFVGFVHVRPVTAALSGERRAGQIRFGRGPATRRDLLLGGGLNGSTTVSNYASTMASAMIMSYGAPGNQSNNFFENIQVMFTDANTDFNPGSIVLPNNFTNTNPAFTSDSNPVFHSMPFMPYITDSLPSDFGLTFHYATNTFSPGDTFVVSAGTEEWEVLDFAANTSSVTGASPLFLARMV